MTRKEILQYIKSELANENAEIYLDVDDYKIIVEALEQESVIDKIRADVGRLKHKNTDYSGYRWWNNAIDNCLLEIDKYQSRK